MIDRSRAGSTLSIVLAAVMAVPSTIPLNFSLESSPTSSGPTRVTRTRIALIRKLDRISLLGWGDSPTIGDQAKETDETPFPPVMASRVLDLTCLVPSSTQGFGSRRPDVSMIGLRNPPLRC